jgi:arylsulfatase A-like enzyme
MISIKKMREKALKLIALGSFLLLGFLTYGQASKPNIIYILSDDQAWSDYGFMGHPIIETPNIDKMAQEGLTFTRGYVTAPLCSPSLASIITGLYPHQHGITGNDPAFDFEEKRYGKEWQMQRSKLYDEYLDEFQKHPTVPELLKEEGYLSFQSGKWWGGNWKEGGFTHGMTHGDPGKGGRHGDEGLKIGREGMQTIFDFMDAAISQDKPFFVWYAPFLPHSPHTPPDSLLQKYLPDAPTESIAKYWAMCEWLDITVGQLLDRVEEKGLTENTLVVFVTDNGWIQDPEVANVFVPGSKQAPLDMGIRTPIIFKWPGKITPDMDSTTLVSSIDIAVSSLAAAGLGPSPEMEGINVLDAEALKARDKIFSLDFAHDMVHVDQPEKSLESRIIITNPWKLIDPNREVEQKEEVQLYNIYQDPFEKKNLATKNPDIVKGLREELDKWWTPEL